MSIVSYIRGYQLTDEVSTKLADTGKALPSWYAAHVQKPFQILEKPVAWEFDPIPADYGGQQLELQRLVVLQPAAAILEVTIWLEDVETDVAPLGVSPPHLIVTDVGWKVHEDDVSGQHSAAWVCDQTFKELTELPIVSTNPLRTTLCTLVVSADPDDCHASLPELQTTGREMLHSTAHQVVITPQERSAERPSFERAVVVLSIFLRARHTQKLLIRETGSVARTVKAGSENPWQDVHTTAKIQAGYVLFRQTHRGEGFLNTDVSKQLHRALEPALGGAALLEDLEAAVSSLDSLSQSLLSIAIEQTQDRLGKWGLLFGLLSIVFASFAVTDIADSTNPTRLWVLAAVFFVVALSLGYHSWIRRSKTRPQD